MSELTFIILCAALMVLLVVLDKLPSFLERKAERKCARLARERSREYFKRLIL